MSDVNNDYAFSTVHFSETQNYGPESTEGNRESTLLTEALISVRNSSHRLNKGSTLAKMPTYLNQSWQWLRTPSDNPVSVVNGSGKEETELQEILIEGEKLRRLGDLLRAPKTEETVPHGWRDNILKRFLIGISLIGASGYTGFRFYNANPPSGSQQNALSPLPDMVKTGGKFIQSSGHNALYHDDAARHRREVQPKDAYSVPVPINSSNDKKVESSKECYKYYGMGRLRGKKTIPCSDKVNPNIMVNNKRSGPAPYPYIYTSHQPQKCKTPGQESKCQKTHQIYHNKHHGKKLSKLVLKVGKTPCHCPPPMGDHVRLMPIQTKKMNVVTFENEIPASKLLVIPLPSTHQKLEMRHNIDNDLDKIPARTTIANPVAFLNAEDDVKIEKMYDFSCIDKRNNMSWADIIRQVGETLTSPVESLARESQIVHYHNSLGEGCPGQPESKRLQEYTGRVDAILSGVMQLIPGANPLTVLQLIVGPALEIYADELDEKPLDLQKINNINQQVLFCSRKEIQTLSAKEKMRIFTGASTNEIIKKLDTINGEVAVKIGEEKYVLHNDLYDSPFIEIDGVQRYIHFNNKDKAWVFNAENDTRSSSYLSSMKIDTYKSNFSYNADNDFIITPDDEIVDTRNKRKYLLINGKEVHVIDGIEKNSFFPASSIISGDVIKKGEGEYYFEAESAPVDSEVAEILDVDVNEFISGGDKTSIKPNLLSLDNNKHRYVKYHNLYHPLENGSELFIERIDGSLAIITTRSGRLSVAKVVKQNLPDAEHLTGGLFITRDLKIKLEQEGATLNYSGYKSSDGMKLDADSVKNHLQINNNVYKAVHSSHSPWIFVENKKDGYPDIPVFLYDDVLIQGKEGFMEDTSSLSNCRMKRSTGIPATCIRKFSPESAKILRSVKPEIISTELVPVEEFPGVYVDNNTKRLFLKFKNQFFLCKYVADDVNKTFKNGVLKIQKKIGWGILSKRKTIANFTYHDEGGMSLIKTVDEEIARITKMKLQDANKITHGRHNRKIELTETLKQIRKMDNLNPLPGFRTYVSTDISKVNIKEAIGKTFFKGNKTWRQTELNKVGDDIDFRVRLSAKRLKLSKDHALNVLNSAKNELDNLTLNTVIYLRTVLGTTNDNLVADFSRLLSSRLDKTQQALERSKIILCHSIVGYDKPVPEHDPVRDAELPDGEWEKVHWKPNYDKYGLKRMAMAFTYSKGDEIYINVDKLGGIDPTSSTKYLRQPYSIEPFLTLIHEASHKNDLAKDLMYIPIENNDYIPILDAMDELAESFSRMEFHNPELLRPLLSDYFRTAPSYMNVDHKELFKSKNLHAIYKYDPGFRASIMLNTPDFLAKLASDINMNKFVQT